MKTSILAVLLSGLVVSGTGCYLGRASGAKKIAYVANGAIAATGALMLVGAQGNGGDEEELVTNISLVPLVVGLAGIALNVAVGTEAPEQPVTAHVRADGTVSTALR